MAPIKQGLDYFKYSLGLLKDRKFRPAKSQFGAAASVAYLALLELIYSDKGYYVVYDDNLIWDVQEYLQGAYCPNADTVRKIIETLVACGLFDDDQFRAKILTSKRVQMEYYNSTVERKAVKIDFSIWLLTESEMRAISGKSVILHNFTIQANIAANRANCEDNQPSIVQRREEKSREEQSGAEERRCSDGALPAPEAPPEWIRELPIFLPPSAPGEIAQFLAQGLTRELIEWAAEETLLKAEGDAKWSYMRRILEDKAGRQIYDMDDLPGKKRSKGKAGAFWGTSSYDAFDNAGFTLPEV